MAISYALETYLMVFLGILHIINHYTISLIWKIKIVHCKFLLQ